MSQTNTNPVEKTFLLGSVFKERPSIGFIISDPDCSQYVFELIHETFRFLELTNRIEICYFSIDWRPFSMTPPTAVYDLEELCGYRGNIVTPTINGIIDTLRVKTIKDIIYYCYNPLEVSQYSPQSLYRLLSDSRVTTVLREIGYLELIKQHLQSDPDNPKDLEIQICPSAIPIPAINEFSKLIYNKSYDK